MYFWLLLDEIQIKLRIYLQFKLVSLSQNHSSKSNELLQNIFCSEFKQSVSVTNTMSKCVKLVLSNMCTI